METFVALLRGINVSGKYLIKMDILKQKMQESGLLNVQTYIQSGNIVFQSGCMNADELEELMQKKIAADFGFDVPVMVKTKAEIENAILGNDYIAVQQLPVDKLHLTFLSEIAPEAAVAALSQMEDAHDKMCISNNLVYLYCPNGYGQTKFTNTFFEKKLKCLATTRNWKTILKLAEMMNR